MGLGTFSHYVTFSDFKFQVSVSEGFHDSGLVFYHLTRGRGCGIVMSRRISHIAQVESCSLIFQQSDFVSVISFCRELYNLNKVLIFSPNIRSTHR